MAKEPYRETTAVLGRLGLVGRGSFIGAVVGWILTVLGAEVLILVDLVSRVRNGTTAELGGVYGLFAVILLATAWGALGGVILGAPTGALLGALVGALIPRRIGEKYISHER
jgi:hypothetical protein